MDIRCPSKKHGELIEPGLVEVKCDSKFCGAEPGVSVIHRFDTITGKMLDTLKFKDPRKDQVNGSHNHPAAVRSA